MANKTTELDDENGNGGTNKVVVTGTAPGAGQGVVNPNDALAASISSMLAKYQASGNRVRNNRGYFGPTPVRARDRAEFFAQMDANRFTRDDAAAFGAMVDAAGLTQKYAPVLRQMGVETDAMRRARYDWARRSNERTARDDRERSKPYINYAAWGGRENYEAAQRMNQFYKDNKANWGDILDTVSGGTFTRSDFDQLPPLEKQAMVKFLYDNAQRDDKGNIISHKGQLFKYHGDGEWFDLKLDDGDEAADRRSKSWHNATKWTRAFKKSTENYESNRYIGPVKPKGTPFLQGEERAPRSVKTWDDALRAVSDGNVTAEKYTTLLKPTRRAIEDEIKDKYPEIYEKSHLRGTKKPDWGLG